MARYVFCLDHVFKSILSINTHHSFTHSPTKTETNIQYPTFFSKKKPFLSHIYDSILVWN